jgi:hypothetical protein
VRGVRAWTELAAQRYQGVGFGVKELVRIGEGLDVAKDSGGKCKRGLTGATLAGLDARIGLRIRVRVGFGFLEGRYCDAGCGQDLEAWDGAWKCGIWLSWWHWSWWVGAQPTAR